MKTLCVTLLTVVALALNASAVTFQGTITGTVVGVPMNSPLGLTAPGDTFTGTYSYNSATVDGGFSPAIGNLQVSLTFPDSTVLTESDDGSFPTFPSLLVAGGSVVGFSFAKSGELSFRFGLLNWLLSAPGDGDNEFASGTLAFSNPTPQTAPSTGVPDGGSTMLLLGTALVGLGFLKFRRSWAAA